MVWGGVAGDRVLVEGDDQRKDLTQKDDDSRGDLVSRGRDGEAIYISIWVDMQFVLGVL